MKGQGRCKEEDLAQQIGVWVFFVGTRCQGREISRRLQGKARGTREGEAQVTKVSSFHSLRLVTPRGREKGATRGKEKNVERMLPVLEEMFPPIIHPKGEKEKKRDNRMLLSMYGSRFGKHVPWGEGLEGWLGREAPRTEFWKHSA